MSEREIPVNLRLFKLAAIGLSFLVCGLLIPGVSGEEIPVDLAGKLVVVKTLNGGSFRGELTRILDDRLELILNDGTIVQISRKSVIKVVPLEGIGKSNPYFEDADANRLIIAPTGFGMEPGEFHISDKEIVLVTSSYGVTSWFSLWAGVSLPGAVFNARFSHTFGDRLGCSIGSFAGVWWLGGSGELVLPYGIFSLGTENKNLTFGIGNAFASHPKNAAVESTNYTPPALHFGPSTLIIVAGGKIPLSSSVALISENWIAWNYYDSVSGQKVWIIPMIVFRIAGPRLSWDIGVTLPMTAVKSGIRDLDGQNDNFIPIPILSLTYRIN